MPDWEYIKLVWHDWPIVDVVNGFTVRGGTRETPWEAADEAPPASVLVTYKDGREWEVTLVEQEGVGRFRKLLLSAPKARFHNPNKIPTSLDDTKMAQAMAIVWYGIRFRMQLPLDYDIVDWTDAA